jgi:hypothetical protein
MSNISDLQARQQQRDKPVAPRLPRQLQPVQRLYVSRLAEALAATLDGADDKLFDMADNAPPLERNRYFDAMQELRAKRSDVEKRFRVSLEEHFVVLSRLARGEKEATATEEVDIDSLSLVNQEDMEADVAVENIARRARGTCDEALRAFNHRLEYLFESRFEVTDRNSPLDPRQIASAFEEAMTDLDLDIQARLIVMKLFERGVLDQLSGLVDAANDALIHAGVLPEMKKAPIKRKQPEPEKPAGKETQDADQSQSEAVSEPQAPGGRDDAERQPVFGMLQNLLNRWRSPDQAPAPGPGQGPGDGTVAGGGAAPAAGPGSAAGFSGAPEPPPMGEAGQPVNPNAPWYTPPNMAVMHQGVPYINGVPAGDTPVQPVESDSLVSLLTRIQRLEEAHQQVDGNLDEVNVKDELSGLLTEAFGDDKVHALDENDGDIINLVGMMFDFILDDDSLPAEIKALVGRLQIPLLKVAIADQTFFSDDTHPARELLNLLARAGSQWSPEQGLDDELYRRIEASVYRILNEFETDTELFTELLDGMQEFLSEQEQRRDRVEARVREQEEGKARAEHAQQQVRAVVDTRMAGRKLPEVVVELIRHGWENVLYLTWLRDGEDSDNWKRRAKLLDALVWSVLPHREEKALKKLDQLSPRLISGLQQGLEAVNHDPVETRTLLMQLREEHQRLLKGERIDRVRVREQEQEDAGAGMLDEDHPRVREAAALQPGQWIEIGLGEGARRCKLAANIRRGEKLVFINRRGMKVVEHNAQSLGMAFEQGVARLIDEGALFDRALEAVIGGLRQNQHVDGAH